jgi:hypothetical protein
LKKFDARLELILIFTIHLDEKKDILLQKKPGKRYSSIMFGPSY